MTTTDPIRGAVNHLRRLPGIGEKTATRLVYWLLTADKGVASGLAGAIGRLEEEICECSVCCDLSADPICKRCLRPHRDDSLLAVVESSQDLMALERSGEFGGRYHVLHGAISPLDGITPDRLRIRALLERLRDGTVTEVILATNPTIEGDATALYIARLLDGLELRVTRLAHGISVGTELEYADSVSLARALSHRVEFS